MDVKKFSKKKWKVFVEEKINELNREFLLEELEKYKKVDALSLSLEKFEMKQYFKDLSLENSRMKLRERSLMMNYCRSHYHNDRKNISKNYRCFHCMEIDSLEHWRYSKCYENMRKNKDLSQDIHLVQFYLQIIELRKKM